MDSRLFTKEEMAEFMIKHIREAEPGVAFSRNEEGDMLYNVRFDGDNEAVAVINFENIWIAYRRTNDLNCVIEGMNAQIKAMRMSRDWETKWDGFREEHVFPVLRPKHYATVQPAGTGRMLYDAAVEGLDTLFMEQRDGLGFFLNKELVPQQKRGYLKRAAYDNLRKAGWFPAEETFPALNMTAGGKIHVYTDSPHPFQLQFFLKDMREKAMPSTFLVAFPSYDTAVALTVEDSIESSSSAVELAVRSGLVQFISLLYYEEPRPLSLDIYWVSSERFTRVYRRLEPRRGRKIG
jgi:hypothetical protein